MKNENRSRHGINASIHQLMSVKNCSRKGEYLGLGLLMPYEQSMFRQEIRKVQGGCLGESDAPEKVERFIYKNISRSWYLMNAEYDAVLKEEAAYHKRLASFFVGKKRIAENLCWTYPVSFMMDDGRRINSVFGHVCAVLEEENQNTAVIIMDGSPVYTARARKKENHPEYAPELIGAYLGLQHLYGRNMRVMLVYLKKKKDSIESPFDPGRQIITVDFSQISIEELDERLRAGLTVPDGQADCPHCNYASLCSKSAIPKKQPMEEGKRINTLCFTEAQKEVVHFGEGACAVYAVPGAGKTTTLVYRLLRMVEEGIDPKSILFVTFTNKAADEIRSRIQELLHTDFEEEMPDIFTYNGLGWQILLEHPEYTGDIKLLTAMDEKRILMECIDAFPERLEGYSYRYIEGAFGLLALLLKSFKKLDEDSEKEVHDLRAKNHDPDQVQRLKDMYDQRIGDEGYITFDAQITLAKELLQKHPDIQKGYAKRWRYLMADEYQDSSADNVALLYGIAEAGERNLVVVGDYDQSIYEWRNGSPKHLLDFPKYFPECRQIYMTDNFRSVKQILEASNHLISLNPNRIQMSMIAHKESKVKPYRVLDCDLSKIPLILEMLKKRNFAYGDIAILSRTNAPLSKVKVMLDKIGIGSISPTDYLIRDPFFLLVKDILDLYFDGFETTDLAFYRFMQACGCTLPEKKDRNRTFYENLVEFYFLTPIDTENMDSMMEYAVDDVSVEGSETPLYMAAKRLFRIFLALNSLGEAGRITEVVCQAFHADEDAPAVQAFVRRMQYQMFSSLRELWLYLGWMVELEDDAKVEYAATREKVNLMTAHCSKGKEFPAVIILQSEDFKETEEERRLFYVAMTRAKKCLFALESPYMKCGFLGDISDYVQDCKFA